MKKPAEAIHVTFTVFWRFYQKIIRLSTLEIEWYIDWLLFYNQQIKQGCVLVYRYTKEGNINELRHNSMYGYENKRNSLVYRYTRTAPKTVTYQYM